MSETTQTPQTTVQNNAVSEPVNANQTAESQVTNVTIKTEISTPEQKPNEIKIINGEKEGTQSHGFIENIRKKWQAHVEKNKKVALEKNLAQEQNAEREADFFENFDPKKDKKKLTPKIREKILAAEKIYQEGVSSIKDVIAPTSMQVLPTKLRINNTYVKSFYVYNYPRYLETTWLNDIVNLDVSMDISIFMYPTDSAKIMKILRKKVAEMRSTRSLNAKRGAINDTALDTALEDAEQLRVDLQRGMERFFQVGLYLTVYSDDEKKLTDIGHRLETRLNGQLVMTRSSDFQCERAFETTLPQATDLVDVVRNMNTNPLSTTFPFVSNDLTSNEGILYGLNRHNNSLIIFDRFNLENANEVVFAKSGAGKSFAVKLEILRSLMMGTDVIVLDPENEYETLAHTVGGSYIRISLNSDQRINPFDLPLSLNADERPGEVLRENAVNLAGLMSLMLGNLNPSEQGVIDQAILQTYALKGITMDTPNPHEYEMPTMNDLQSILESMSGGQDLAVRLERFTKGTFSGLFSTQTNVNLDNQFVAFCIRDLEESLRPISMYILLNFIWNRVRSKLKKRLLVIDEAWNIVQYEDSGRFLHGLVKRARKYYLGITTITQDVEDFLDSPWGKPIITNSSLQLLLRQSTVAIEKLEKIFNLTKQERYLLLNSGVGQGLFFAGAQHVAIEVIASYNESKIITTNPEEILQQQNE